MRLQSAERPMGGGGACAPGAAAVAATTTVSYSGDRGAASRVKYARMASLRFFMKSLPPPKNRASIVSRRYIGRGRAAKVGAICTAHCDRCQSQNVILFFGRGLGC